MKVQCNVWNPNGSLRVQLTYEAPDDAKVGESGRVQIFDRDSGRVDTFDATIASLTGTYAGRCRPFVRTSAPTPK